MVSQEAVDLFISVLVETREIAFVDVIAVDHVAQVLANRLEQGYAGYDSEKIMEQYLENQHDVVGTGEMAGWCHIHQVWESSDEHVPEVTA